MALEMISVPGAAPIQAGEAKGAKGRTDGPFGANPAVNGGFSDIFGSMKTLDTQPLDCAESTELAGSSLEEQAAKGCGADTLPYQSLVAMLNGLGLAGRLANEPQVSLEQQPFAMTEASVPMDLPDPQSVLVGSPELVPTSDSDSVSAGVRQKRSFDAIELPFLNAGNPATLLMEVASPKHLAVKGEALKEGNQPSNAFSQAFGTEAELSSVETRQQNKSSSYPEKMLEVRLAVKLVNQSKVPDSDLASIKTTASASAFEVAASLEASYSYATSINRSTVVEAEMPSVDATAQAKPFSAQVKSNTVLELVNQGEKELPLDGTFVVNSKAVKAQSDLVGGQQNLTTQRSNGADTLGQFESHRVKTDQSGSSSHNASSGASDLVALFAPIGRLSELPRQRSMFKFNPADGTAVPQSGAAIMSNPSIQIAPAVASAEVNYVAEQASYWMSGNIQNAEMTLDGLDGKPVEVSINMSGNEAHVAFRTDELQTRAALENASAHLKDLLRQEGLVLTGVSVGTAGAGDSSAQDRSPRQGAGQTNAQPVGASPSSVRIDPGRATGRSLDIFV
jgi:flagellar hook-length control protein FliK